MYIRDYVTGAFEVIQKNGDASVVLQNLRKYLEKRGLTKLYPSILRGVTERIRRAEKSGIPKVILARTEDEKTYAVEIKDALTKLEATAHEIQVDESIIGGFIVKGKNERIDSSFKNTLLQAYRRLTD